MPPTSDRRHREVSVNTLIFYGFVAFFSGLTVDLFFVRSFFSHYIFSEWLINYSQGFIRRGLPGSLLLFLKSRANLDPYPIVKYLNYIIFVLFSGLYLVKIYDLKERLNWQNLLVFLFLPSLLLFSIYNPTVIGRKEFLFFLLLIFHLDWLEKKFLKPYREESIKSGERASHTNNQVWLDNYQKTLFIWFNLLAIPCALSHEAILFLSLPINLIITFIAIRSVVPTKRAISRTLFIYSPTIFLTLLGYFWKGNESTAREICRAWETFQVLDCHGQLPGALEYLSWPLSLGLKASWEILTRNYSLVALQWIGLCGLHFLLILDASSTILERERVNSRGLDTLENLSSLDLLTSFSFRYAFLPLLFSLPLYAITLDWGRWFFCVMIGYVFCSLNSHLVWFEVVTINTGSSFLKNGFFVNRLYRIYAGIIKVLLLLLHRFQPIYIGVLIYTIVTPLPYVP